MRVVMSLLGDFMLPDYGTYIISSLIFFISFAILKYLGLFKKEIFPVAKMGLFLWSILTAFAIASFFLGAMYTAGSLGGVNGQVIASVGACAALLLLSALVGTDVRGELFGSSNSLKKLFKGMILGAVAYPLVTGVAFIMSQGLTFLFGFQEHEQLAYLYLKHLMNKGWLFYAAAFCVGVVVPIAEEILFRGYILGLLSRFLQPHLVALVSGAIFAAFHFSGEQGATNIALFAGLTLFGLLAANLKVTENALCATIGMHAVFNIISLTVLVFGNA